MSAIKRYERGDATYFAPAINFLPIEKHCAFEYVKTIKVEDGKLVVEYSNLEDQALRLPIPIMDNVVDFLNKWKETDRITHIKDKSK